MFLAKNFSTSVHSSQFIKNEKKNYFQIGKKQNNSTSFSQINLLYLIYILLIYYCLYLDNHQSDQMQSIKIHN